MTESHDKVKIKRIRPHGKFVGPIIPNVLLRYRRLPASCKLMWGRLAQYLGKSGDAFPSYDTLADEIGVSRRQAITIIQRLEQDRFLELEHRVGHTCVFHLLKHPCLGGEEVAPPESVKGVKKLHPGGEENDMGGVKKFHPGGEVEFTLRESPKRIKEENHHHHQEPDPISGASENGGGVSFSENGKKPSPLTPDQQAYLELAVDYQEHHGGFKTSRTAFTRWLTKELVSGRRDMADLEDIRTWKDRNQWGTKCGNLDDEKSQADEQREEADRQEQELLREVRAKLVPALAGAPEEHIRYIYGAGYGDMPLYAVQHVLCDEFPELVKQIRQERLDAQEREARERLGLSTRGPMPKKPKSEQITELIAKYLREGDFNQAEAFLPEHPDEYNSAVRIVAAAQPDEMTF